MSETGIAFILVINISIRSPSYIYIYILYINNILAFMFVLNAKTRSIREQLFNYLYTQRPFFRVDWLDSKMCSNRIHTIFIT